MMWTKTVNGLITLFLVVAIIAALAFISIFYDVMENAAIAIGLGIFLVAVVSCSVLGVLVEISKNIAKIAHNSYSYPATVPNSTNQEKSHNNNSYLSSATASVSESKPGWSCPRCGKNNPNSSRVCKDCGYNK